MASTLAKIRQERLDKVHKLRGLGINPYPSQSARSHKNSELTDGYDKHQGNEVTIVGRVMAWREHGQLRFAEIHDASGKIQFIIRKENVSSLNKEKQLLGWSEMGLIDVGDFVQGTGVLTKSKRGEISVDVNEFKLLTKSIRPLPEKWQGIKDTESRFRRRYLDMTMNPDIRDRFTRKYYFWKSIRDYFDKTGFVEVNIPILEHVTGGADANPFVTHFDFLDQDLYLRISHELPLKRLIGGGFEKVYDIGARFRNEGLSDEHLPEHTATEWYWAYADYEDGMVFLEDMFREISENVYGETKFKMKGFDVDFSKKWERIVFSDVLQDKFKVDVFNDSVEKMNDVLKKNGVDLGDVINRNRVVDNLWKLIRKDIAGPAFLVEHPKFLSVLSKSNDVRPEIVDRGQPIIAGSELGNFWSELNDPVDQFERFSEQQDLRDAGDDEAQMMDIDYVEMLEYGMPPCVGFGVSERVFWFYENVTAREGVPFPQLRFELEDTTKEIYAITEEHKSKALSKGTFLHAISTVRNQISGSNIGEVEDSSIISLEPEFVKKFDNPNIGVAIIRGIDVKKSDPELEKIKKTLFNQFRKTIKLEDIDDIPQIASFHKMYKQMGVNLRSRKPSPEAMLRRIAQNKELYTTNTCVDAYNVAVILNQISAGAFDMRGLEFPVVVREAKNGEEIEIIGGEVKKLKNGEVCYFDKNGAYNMDYNFRDAERTKVTEETKDIFINVEGIGLITRDQVADQLQLVVDLITRFCGGEVEMMGMVKSPE